MRALGGRLPHRCGLLVLCLCLFCSGCQHILAPLFEPDMARETRESIPTLELVQPTPTPAPPTPTVAALVAEPLLEIAPEPGLIPQSQPWVTLVVTTSAPADCRWSAAPNRPYAQMPNAFALGKGSTRHVAAVGHWGPHPDQTIYVRCASSEGGSTWDPDEHVLYTRLRHLPSHSPGYPRSADVRGLCGQSPAPIEELSHYDLILGANALTVSELAWLRQSRPDTIILLSLAALGVDGLPEHYYLHDVQSRRIERWHGVFELDLSQPEVAEWLGERAHEAWQATDLLADGIIVDVDRPPGSMSSPWQIVGRGDQASTSAAPDTGLTVVEPRWHQGVERAILTFRQLEPNALIATRNATRVSRLFAQEGNRKASSAEGILAIADDELLPLFGAGLGPQPALGEIMRRYRDRSSPWQESGIVLIGAATTNRSDALDRSALAWAMLGEGYFVASQCQWFEELGISLGSPIGPAMRIDHDNQLVEELIVNGDFEGAIGQPWGAWSKRDSGNTTWLGIEDRDVASGRRAACIEVLQASGDTWQAEFVQYGRSLVAGETYDLRFWAKSSTPRMVNAHSQKHTANWDNYGLDQPIRLDESWRWFDLSFVATATASDARIQLQIGNAASTVLVDQVSLTAHVAEMYQRRFDHGMVLVNGSPTTQTIRIDPGYAWPLGAREPVGQVTLQPGEGVILVKVSGESDVFMPLMIAPSREGG